MKDRRLLVRVRILLLLFVFFLVLSGATAFPLIWGIERVNNIAGSGSWLGEMYKPLGEWVSFIHAGLLEIDREHNFIFYGTDWLAFGHIVIAVFMLGAVRDPVRNVWNIEAAMVACAGVLPLAFICGPIRGIPFFWQLIDCSFGVIGIVPLWLCRKWTKEVERASAAIVLHAVVP